MRKLPLGLVVAATLVVLGSIAPARTSPAAPEPALVELGHVLDRNVSLFPGDPPVEITPWASYEQDGYLLERVSSGTHTGTHMSAPCHFFAAAPCLDDLATGYLRFGAVVIDVRPRLATSAAPAFRLQWSDIEVFEARHGRIPRGSVVLLLTGFGERFGTPAYDAPAPGFHATAVARLFDERGVIGVGSDTYGPDASGDVRYSASAAAYQRGGITLENLTNLDRLDPVGNTVTASPVRLRDGSGFFVNPLAEVG